MPSFPKISFYTNKEKLSKVPNYENKPIYFDVTQKEYQQRFEQPKPVYVPSQNGGVPPPLADPRVDEGNEAFLYLWFDDSSLIVN